MRRIENILVYVDDVSATLSVSDRIVEWAQASQAGLTLVGVVEPTRSWIAEARGVVAEAENELAVYMEGQLNELARTFAQSGLDVQVQVYRGDPATVLVQAVLRDGIDLVYKAYDPERSDSGLSSVERRLLRVCPCPVAILRPLQVDHGKRVLVAVDFDPEQPEKGAINDDILELAARAALVDLRELHILHVWRLFGESSLAHGFARVSEEHLNELRGKEEKEHRDWIEALVKKCLDSLGSEAVQYLTPKIHLLKGDPRKVIPAQVDALRPDLLVIGSVARTGVSGLLMGNTAEAILNEVDCSVATIKPPGFESPIQPATLT
jgi:nucleotide-binding universal stress UspA family protein